MHEFREKDLGRVSPYHAAPGIWLTRALLARAAGNITATDRAIGRYIESVADAETEQLDLTLGKSASLLGAAVLYSARPAPALRRLGDHLVGSVWERLNREPPIAEDENIAYLGIAHGWAGFVYAALAWARATAAPPAPSPLERLAQLGELTLETGSGLRTPITAPGRRMGWGTAQWMDGGVMDKRDTSLCTCSRAGCSARPKRSM